MLTLLLLLLLLLLGVAHLIEEPLLAQTVQVGLDLHDEKLLAGDDALEERLLDVAESYVLVAHHVLAQPVEASVGERAESVRLRHLVEDEDTLGAEALGHHGLTLADEAVEAEQTGTREHGHRLGGHELDVLAIERAEGRVQRLDAHPLVGYVHVDVRLIGLAPLGDRCAVVDVAVAAAVEHGGEVGRLTQVELVQAPRVTERAHGHVAALAVHEQRLVDVGRRGLHTLFARREQKLTAASATDADVGVVA